MPEDPSPRPPDAPSDKADARRRQILDAARCCVLQGGFHGSSMQQIAQAAALSVGQIYRYFENKEAIIAALAAQDIIEKRERFAALEALETPLAENLLALAADAISRSIEANHAAVLVEVVSEAARNPKVAEIVRAADTQESALRRSMLRHASPAEVSDAEIDTRAEVLAAIFDGLSVREVIRPMAGPGRPDRDELLAVLKPIFAVLVGPPCAEPERPERACG